MANVTVSLPDPMKEWVAELQPLIDAGLASGISERSMEEVRQDACAAARSTPRARGL